MFFPVEGQNNALYLKFICRKQLTVIFLYNLKFYYDTFNHETCGIFYFYSYYVIPS